MPLDTGALTELEHQTGKAEPVAPPEDLPPTLASGADLGQALRAVREYKGLALEDVAEATRVRRAYLDAIETMRLEALPSRPFTIGYIRAYASQLGLDPEAAVARFRREQPDPDTGLREPVGVQSGKDPRLALLGVAGAAIIAAIFTWNVVQRAMSDDGPEPAPVAKAPAVAAPAARAKDAAVALGAPLPPPVESTTPPLYETPGLKEAAAAEAAASGAVPTAAPPAPAPTEPVPPPNLAPTFQAKGKVYGPPAAESSGVVLQALRPAALMVRSPDGTVHFARYLAAGESYRVPTTGGLTVDVPETNAFQVFAGGESKGVLPTGVTAVSKLGPVIPKTIAVAPPAAKPAAAPAAAAPAAAAPAPAAPRPAPAAPAAVATPAPAPQAAPQQ